MMLLSKVLNLIKKNRYFLSYIFFFIFISLIVHKEVLFNPYNYGRHWDWSLYPTSDDYRNYFQSFFYSIKQNTLGYFDVFSIILSEFFVKLFIYSCYSLLNSFFHIHVSLAVINKFTIFVFLPFISTIGIWTLSRSVLRDIFVKNKLFFFTITIFANFVYTYSLVLIFDLHGGALNRAISSSLFPLYFAFLYNYFIKDKVEIIDVNIIALSLIYSTFDISNLFYFGVLTLIFVLVKRSNIKIKAIHLILIFIMTVVLNIYWVQALLIGNTTNSKTIVQERKTDNTILAAYSASYAENIFVLSTPHNLIERAYVDNPFIYIPFFSIYALILFFLINKPSILKKKKLIFILVAGFIFTTQLTNGAYSFQHIYEILYSFDIFAFIRNAIRYMPNLAIYTLFFFLVILREYYSDKTIYRKKDFIPFLIPTLCWMIFICLNLNLITLINTKIVGNSKFNHEIGALYEYNPYINEVTRNEKLVYNILPIPSWFSPVFIDNVYPKTSQGSDTESGLLNKGVIYTYGLTTFSSNFLNTFINSKTTPLFYSIINLRYIWFRNLDKVDELTRNLYFSNEWVTQTSLEDLKKVDKAIQSKTVYRIPSKFFLPQIYIPKKIVISNGSLLNFPSLLDNNNIDTAYFFNILNSGKNTPNFGSLLNVPTTLEFKKINTTKYRVLAHKVARPFPLVLSVPYQDSWNLFVAPYTKPAINKTNLNIYKILEGNEADQATKSELGGYINSGYISTLGDLTTKKFEHIHYQNGLEYNDHLETYNIDFISKDFYGTIQNDNLANGLPWETWFSYDNASILNKIIQIISPQAKMERVNPQNHLYANQYANAWIVDPNVYCKKSFCKKNVDGSYEMQFIIDFIPQRNYAIYLIITLSAYIAFISFVLFHTLLKKNEK